jgi:aryl-alcohol dehydrogenase-like predicted oxidoreductase
MERRRFANTDLTVSIIGLGCYSMSGAYGPTDDAESIATIHRALDLGVNFLDTSASYGQGHNHRLIGEAIRGRRHDVVIRLRRAAAVGSVRRPSRGREAKGETRRQRTPPA